MKDKPAISVIGPGAVGTALLDAFGYCGYEIKSIFSRKNPAQLKHLDLEPGALKQGLPAGRDEVGDLLFIATPDDVIQEVADKLSDRLKGGKKLSVVHCSGSQTSDLLQVLADEGMKIASFHPIQTFSPPLDKKLFSKITISIEGNRSLCKQLEKIAADFEANPLILDKQQKRVMHIAAVFMSNYVVALASVADQLISERIPDADIKAFYPLLKQTVKNILDHSPAEALTGPIARADLKTIRQHLDTLEDGETRMLYLLLGNQALTLAEKKGSLTASQVKKLRDLLEDEQ